MEKVWTASQRELWQRLQDFQFDAPGAELTFSHRLVREQGWTPHFADRAIEEYRRFLFLTLVAGEPVCPSEQVDEVWHLHLTYTESYWEQLCPQVLGRALHHHPTTGGPDQLAHHVAMYERTLASYEHWFLQPPPRDLWPPAEERFDSRSRYQRVDLSRWWILPRPRWLRLPKPDKHRHSVALFSLGLPLLAAAMNPLDLRGPEFLTFFAVATGAGFLVWLILRHLLRVTSALAKPEGISPIEVGFLSLGVEGALAAALSEMLHSQTLQIVSESGERVKLKAGLPVKSSEGDINKAIWQQAQQKSRTLISLKKSLNDEWEQLESSLIDRGLLISRWRRVLVKWLPLTILGILLLLGGVKIWVGVQRNRPVEFLVMAEVALFVATSWAFKLQAPSRSLAGDSVLRQLRAQRRSLLKDLNREPAAIPPGSAALAAGLFGYAILADSPFSDLVSDFRSSFRPVTPTASGGSGCSGTTGCGSGCGGGGCGSGCGGCS